MILEKLLMPDEVYSSFEELTPEHMKELGKKYIFSDIDNTLATYDDMYPPENVKKWCARMAENGIKVAFVSNNNLERVEKFNSHFGYAAYSKAGKPKTGKLKLAMAEYGASVDESVLLGRSASHRCSLCKTRGYVLHHSSADKRQKNAVLPLQKTHREAVYEEIHGTARQKR